jgi:alpha-galactosidase
LSLAEVQSLTTAIAVTGGSVLLSDDLTKLPEDRRRIAEGLLPVLGERARVIDWFDSSMPAKLRLDQLNETGEWHLVAKFNWSDQAATLSLSPHDFQLDEDEYWFSDFWGGQTKRLAIGEAFVSAEVPAHGCVMGTFRRVNGGSAQYLGSDLHFSQGKEVANWQASEKEVSFTLRLPRKASGQVKVALPWIKAVAELEGEPVEFVKGEDGIWSLPENSMGLFT